MAEREPDGPRAATFEHDGMVFAYIAVAERLSASRLVRLTPAERAIAQLIVNGKSNAAIAAARHTSVRTIANQVAKMLRKTGCASRNELVLLLVGEHR